ncbi:MAG TPA: hypothetical protein VIV06_08715 [Candidatus Limnocylindrales bacterium]
MIGANTAWPEILEFASAEVAWARAHGVAFTEADGTLGEAYALAALGEIDAALARITSVEAMFGALPSVVGQAGEALLLEAQIRQDAGELDEALELRTRAIETFAAAGEPRWEATARTAQAHSLIDVGRIDEASASLARLADDPHVRGSRRLRVFIGQARAALAEGRPDDARRIAGDVQRDLDEHALNDAQGIRVHEALGLIYRDLGQPDLASANLQAALRAATSKDDRVSRERLERRLEQPGAPIRR